jgi:hypothetical protein
VSHHPSLLESVVQPYGSVRSSIRLGLEHELVFCYVVQFQVTFLCICSYAPLGYRYVLLGMLLCPPVHTTPSILRTRYHQSSPGGNCYQLPLQATCLLNTVQVQYNTISQLGFATRPSVLDCGVYRIYRPTKPVAVAMAASTTLRRTCQVSFMFC